MKPKTQEQMLTDIVQAMCKETFPNPMGQGKTIVHFQMGYSKEDALRDMKRVFDQYSLPDLLRNKEAMKAAYGDEKTCTICGMSRWSYSEVCNSERCMGINFSSTPRWSYIAHKALDLLHEGGDAIQYLWEQLPNNKTKQEATND